LNSSTSYPSADRQPAVPDDALDRFERELQQAVLIRRCEERLLELFAEGKLFGTVHTCIGQEFVGVAVARALVEADSMFSNHRGHGHFLARTGNVPGLVGEVMGKSIGVCGGRGGSQHLQQGRYYSNGIQGGIVPVTAGLAMAHKLRADGGIGVVFLGDGTLGEGAVYEAFNLASKWELPVLFVCENNLFAQSTCQTQTLAGDIAARAASFGIATAHSNTWDWPQLFADVEQSVAQIRDLGKPVFHRIDTFRLMAHSKGDDNRPAEYVADHRQRDPIEALGRRFGRDPRWQRIEQAALAQIEAAVVAAEQAEFGGIAPPERRAAAFAWSELSFERERIVQSVRRGLSQAMASDSRVLLLGEDIESPYGGAFKCTLGLSDEFPGRVRNAPISELGLVGLGNGLALGGYRPVVEIMFGDFLTLAADQWINHAAKFRTMFDDHVDVPVVIRTPMGGRRGYASTHSQSLEKHFVGLPDTRVLCLHHRYSPATLYANLLATNDRPTLVIENKLLYGQFCDSAPPTGYRLLASDEEFPTVRLAPEVPADLTLVAVGGMSLEAEQAVQRLFAEEELVVDLFLPTCLYPFDIEVLADSLRQTRRLIVVEEGQGFASLGSEILAQAAERFGHLGLACRRVAAAPCVIPAARPLEERCLPAAHDIVAATLEIWRELVH